MVVGWMLMFSRWGCRMEEARSGGGWHQQQQAAS